MADSQPNRLPLLRLLLAGMAVPAACAALDHALLTQLMMGTANGSVMVLTLAAFIFQVGLFGVMCGKFIDHPVLRWAIYIWCWVLVDLQCLTAGSLAGPSYYWGNMQRLLPTSLFNAQLGLVTIWAVLGTLRWYFRLPAALVLATLCALPLLDSHYHGSELGGLFFMQTCVLAFICGVLRWQRFRLVQPVKLAAEARGDLTRLQFGVRHVLIWTTSLAVVLALARALNVLSPGFVAEMLGQRWLVNVTAGGLIAVVLVLALWAGLGEGSWLRLLALAIVAPQAGTLVAASEWYNHWNTPQGMWAVNPPLWSSAYWNGWWDTEWWLCAWTCLAGGLLFAALLIYRTLGYRLTRTRRAA